VLGVNEKIAVFICSYIICVVAAFKYLSADNGIMNGNGDGTINPTGTATRAEAAQMLMNFLK
jgi:hypothetical protein